ncbi:vacuolar protein sorting-associated protein 72 homolog [Ischnura elegans]|uniref:vacuolar protein sorting-associated protein 72 homolog n=1 Tax=Ischnura elegans TaxID=197161 RepID=UPI001ED8A5EC|nr:vacuolar protein sorting-associated protein 72 homolog [Ischnura elegans]
MALASGRDRRSTAGNRLARLLNEEEEDDFYKTTYGGFSEAENDDDYKSEEEVEDEVDSDFSIEENDEPVSDQDEEGTKRKRRLVTKAYKEPSTAPKVEKPKVGRPRGPRKRISSEYYERKSIRKSTAAKSAETQRLIKERTEGRRKRKVRHYRPEDMRKLTQEELLEEARVTEQENLKSLEKYQKLELEKKKTRSVKKTYFGPIIRYHSMSMPLVDESLPVEKISVDEEDKGPDENEEDSKADSAKSCDNLKQANEELKDSNSKETDSKDQDKLGARCERTFITFMDEQVFHDIFPQKMPKSPTKAFCPLTRLPARYFDPVTELPYCNLQSFRILREAYYQQLEGKGDRSNPEVARWIEWRRRQKELKAAIAAAAQNLQVKQNFKADKTSTPATRGLVTPITLS